MTEKISTLVLKVDLNCPECCKKIKKTLCKYGCVIRSQVIDKKANTVTISGPFDPNCFSKKLCCKAGKAIISIEIKPAPKPDPPKPPPKEPEPAPKKPEPEPAPKKPEPAPKEPEPAPKKTEPAPKKPEPVPKAPEPIHVPVVFEPRGPVHVPFSFEPVTGYPPIFGVCCGQCYHGQGGGPCQHGYGRPTPPPPPGPPCYDGYQRAPQFFFEGYGYGYGHGRRVKGCYVPCDYFSEENPDGCTIM